MSSITGSYSTDRAPSRNEEQDVIDSIIPGIQKSVLQIYFRDVRDRTTYFARRATHND